jgi:hypothetical protein
LRVSAARPPPTHTGRPALTRAGNHPPSPAQPLFSRVRDQSISTWRFSISLPSQSKAIPAGPPPPLLVVSFVRHGPAHPPPLSFATSSAFLQLWCRHPTSPTPAFRAQLPRSVAPPQGTTPRGQGLVLTKLLAPQAAGVTRRREQRQQQFAFSPSAAVCRRDHWSATEHHGGSIYSVSLLGEFGRQGRGPGAVCTPAGRLLLRGVCLVQQADTHGSRSPGRTACLHELDRSNRDAGQWLRFAGWAACRAPDHHRLRPLPLPPSLARWRMNSRRSITTFSATTRACSRGSSRRTAP